MKSDDILVELAVLNNTATKLLDLAEELVASDMSDDEAHSSLIIAARYVTNRHSVMAVRYQEVKELEREQIQQNAIYDGD